MKTISRIAYSNDKRNRTRSILIMMAICLTTMLLVIISTVGNGGNSFTEKVRRQDHMEAIMVCLFPQTDRS